MAKAASSLRPHIVQVMAERQGRILTTEEIYQLVTGLGVDGFNPRPHHAGPQPSVSPADHQGQPRPRCLSRA